MDMTIEARFEALVNHPLEPGVVVALLRGDDLSIHAAGFMEIERSRPMPTDAIFRISSMSKPIIALALLQLIEDGRLQFEDPVERWLPELSDMRVLKRMDASLDDTAVAQEPITVEQLLNSTMGTGIPALPPGATPWQREVERLGLPGFGRDDPANSLTVDAWLRLFGELPLLAQPGAEWFYNTSSYLQGALVSRVAGRSLSEQIAERVTGPLGMSDTGFFVPAGHQERLTEAYSADMTVFDPAAESAWERPPRIEGSLVSAAADYAAFVRMLHKRGVGPKGRIIGEALLARMLSDRLDGRQRQSGAAFLDGRSWGYGLSVDPGRNASNAFAGEIGWAGGLGSSWTSYLGEDKAIIILGCRAIDAPDVYEAHVALTELARD